MTVVGTSGQNGKNCRWKNNFLKNRPINKPTNPAHRSSGQGFFLIALVLTGLIALILILLKFPLYPAYMLGINPVTFAIFGYDKQQAKNRGRRVPEIVLHVLALMGGALGGLIGQWLFRHKTRKPIFHIVLWFSLVVHLTIFAAFYQTLLTYKDWQGLINNISKLFNSKAR
jgi:uncharacterized membrane protein YsdA (DUF1294 family)